MGVILEFKKKEAPEKVKTAREKYESGEDVHGRKCAQCGSANWYWTMNDDHVCASCGQFIEKGSV